MLLCCFCWNVTVQGPFFRDVYSQSNLSMMCIMCFPEVHYLPHLLNVTFLYLRYLGSWNLQVISKPPVNRQTVWVLFYEVLAVTIILHDYINDETWEHPPHRKTMVQKLHLVLNIIQQLINHSKVVNEMQSLVSRYVYFENVVCMCCCLK